MGTDPIDELRRSGEIELEAEGRLRFRGAAARLYRWLDEELERIVLASDAVPFAGTDTIDRVTLERAGYFESFADGAIPAVPGDATRYFVPAACYQVYPSLQAVRLDTGRILTVAACCGRREAGGDDDIGRLRRFRMREAVLVGAGGWVATERDVWIDRVRAFAACLGLVGAIEAASDTFFGSEGRGRRLMQQLKSLKYELRVDAGPAGRLAIASFNLHDTFFTSRFGIGPMADGLPASTGCVAFGVERWTLACLAQHGGIAVDTLVERGVPRFTTNT